MLHAFHEILTCDNVLGTEVLALGRAAQGVRFVIPRIKLCTRTIGSNRLKLWDPRMRALRERALPHQQRPSCAPQPKHVRSHSAPWGLAEISSSNPRARSILQARNDKLTASRSAALLRLLGIGKVTNCPPPRNTKGIVETSIVFQGCNYASDHHSGVSLG